LRNDVVKFKKEIDSSECESKSDILKIVNDLVKNIDLSLKNK